MTLFKKAVFVDFDKDGFELTKLKIDYNYNFMLGQSFERAYEVFYGWIREQGANPEQILEEAGL